MINNEQTGSINATVFLLWLSVAAIAPYESEGGILCSNRGQSCDAFQAILLEETSPRCNNIRVLVPDEVANFFMPQQAFCCVPTDLGRMFVLV